MLSSRFRSVLSRPVISRSMGTIQQGSPDPNFYSVPSGKSLEAVMEEVPIYKTVHAYYFDLKTGKQT